MFAYRDFFVDSPGPRWLTGAPKRGHPSFDDALRAANDWIAAESIAVFHMETVAQESTPYWLRVWYQPGN